ncbi:MAG: hypothetical protein WCX75_03595 [Fibrobacteraceae bacterium]
MEDANNTPQQPSLDPPQAPPEVVSEPIATTQPMVIVETERGFAHYAGIAFLTVLAVFTFFVPGISVVYLVSQLVDINAPAAWIFSAIFSLILWIGFKLKIHGIVKATAIYLAFCSVILCILFIIYFMTDTGNIFGNISDMLFGKSV